MEDLLRLLEVIERDQQAIDARVVIGGKPSDDPRDVEIELEAGWRVVVRFDATPGDVDAVKTRVRALVETFRDAGSARPAAPTRGAEKSQRRAHERLDEQLGETLVMLAERTGGELAMVIDERSPVIWGASSPLALADLDDAERFARLHETRGPQWLEQLGRPPTPTAGPAERVHLHDTGSTTRWLERLRGDLADPSPEGWRFTARAAAALARVRATDVAQSGGRIVSQEDGLGVWARSFAGIYWLVQVFPGRFSEIACEGAAAKALPIIERLVLSLPPLDPEPKGGTLLAFLRSVD